MPALPLLLVGALFDAAPKGLRAETIDLAGFLRLQRKLAGRMSGAVDELLAERQAEARREEA